MKLTPLHGLVVVRLTDQFAEAIPGPWHTKESARNFDRRKAEYPETRRLYVGKVVSAGFEDVTCFTNEDGVNITQKVPMVVKAGDWVFFRRDECSAYAFKDQVFYTIPQDKIFAVIEEIE